jgi:23S rRNA pseudouridine1911/1915/1917 synthase
VRCSICTGRRHQIRLHMSAIGCPIANDVKVGGPLAATGFFDGHQLALHLYETSFLRGDGERATVTMPLGPEFVEVLTKLEQQRPSNI